MKRITSLIIIGFSFIYSINANALTPTITEIDKFIASDGVPLDRYGASVAISGDTAIIGAWGDDDLGADSGSAYIYTRDANGSWTLQQKLTASDGVAGDKFGYVVSLEGDTAVIGVDSLNFELNKIGAAYVFNRDSNGVWSETQKLTAFDQAPGDVFGREVALKGSTLMIGASWDDDGGLNTGSVYVYTSDINGNWTFQQKLLASNGVAYDQFGSALAMDGDTAVITASGYDYTPELTDVGIVYVFKRDATGAWIETQTFLPPQTEMANNSFGQSVAVNGDTILVGADFDDQAGVNAGASYLFTRDSNGVWNQQQKLIASDALPGDYFGQSVAIDGDNLIVGAYGDDDNGVQTGSVYVFSRDTNGNWNERLKLLASDAVDYDYLAMGPTGIGISTNTVLAGAEVGDTTLGVSTGSAYLYDISSSDGPDIALSTSVINFGDLLVGQTDQRLVTLSNNGNAQLTLTSITLASGVDFSQTNNCPATLQPAETCQITVNFTPTIEGALSDTLTVVSDDPDEPSVNVALSGNGITQLPDLVVTTITSPDTLPAGDYATISITIANQGTADVNGGYYAHLYLDSTEIGMTWIGYAPAPGATREVSWFVAVPNYQGNHTLKAVVDTLDDILESNETNNELTKPVSLRR